jgi:hypothetical protein
MLAHFSRHDAEDLPIAPVEPELEHGIGQRLRNNGFNFDRLGLRHAINSLSI